MGVTGIHEFYFSKNTSEASHVSWEDYDYEYKSETYMLDREFKNVVDTPQLLRDPSPGLRIWQSSTTPPIHLILEMDHWLERGEYTPPMNCDLLEQLVGPWV